MNDYDLKDSIDILHETEKLSNDTPNYFITFLIALSTIAVSLFMFLTVKDEFGVAIGLLTPISVTLAAFALVIYFKEIT